MRFKTLLAHLLTQGQTLRHANAMLLVNDGQRKLFELHLVLNQRVGTDHQRRLAAFDQGQHSPALFGLLTAGQPIGLDAQRLQPAHQFAKVLLGQDFSGRHQRALGASLDTDGRGQRCHHRLARAHIALQQAMHGHTSRNVVADFGHHAVLRRGQGKR